MMNSQWLRFIAQVIYNHHQRNSAMSSCLKLDGRAFLCLSKGVLQDFHNPMEDFDMKFSHDKVKLHDRHTDYFTLL